MEKPIFEKIKHEYDLKKILHFKHLITNIWHIDNFIFLLVENEKDNIREREKYNVSYGYILSISFPKAKDEIIIECVKNVMNEKFNKLCYFAFADHEKRYLKIYICERPFIKEGMLEKTITYRNAITGMICNKNDKNAVLWAKPNDKKKYVYFGSKQQLFNYDKVNAYTKGLYEFAYYFEKKLNSLKELE